MGGLRKYMPITFWTFLIASLANAGHDPLRRVLVQGRDHRRRLGHESDPDHDRARSSRSSGWSTAFLTAFYMFRLVFLVFTGKPRFDTARHPSARIAAVDDDSAGAAGDPVGGCSAG